MGGATQVLQIANIGYSIKMTKIEKKNGEKKLSSGHELDGNEQIQINHIGDTNIGNVRSTLGHDGVKSSAHCSRSVT